MLRRSVMIKLWQLCCCHRFAWSFGGLFMLWWFLLGLRLCYLKPSMLIARHNTFWFLFVKQIHYYYMYVYLARHIIIISIGFSSCAISSNLYLKDLHAHMNPLFDAFWRPPCFVGAAIIMITVTHSYLLSVEVPAISSQVTLWTGRPWHVVSHLYTLRL